MIREKGHYVPTFASTNFNDMPNVKYQISALDYAMWYQEHLLRMEDVMGKRLEAKIEEILDRKFHEYMEKLENKNNHL